MTEKATEPAAAVKRDTDTQPKLIEDQIVEREHRVTIGGVPLDYKSVVGTMVQKDHDEDKPKANIFFMAYFKQGVENSAERPLIISFNGGPGSSSVWLHLGMLGPRRVVSGDVDNPVPPPSRLIDNEHSLLDVADMVFIDPVSTGYSRPVPGEEAKQFHGLEPDIESVGEFIRIFVSRYNRWLSPKFLIGESYGTTRAAGLAGHLQDRHGLYLNGLALISVVLDFQTLIFADTNELPYILFLPSYAATAWYHGQLGDEFAGDLRGLLDEVETFAVEEYGPALFRGTALDAAARANLATKLSRYTGLSPAYLEATNLRINIFRFTRELLRGQRRTVGRLDSRFQGIERDAAGEQMTYDPSHAAIQGAYAATLNDYVRRELGFEVDLPYNVLAPLYETWPYSKHENRFAEVAETLRKAMTNNPFMQIYVANGYYDLATPYFATEYTLNHLMLDPTLQTNIRSGYFEAGHMMYVHEASLAELNGQVRAFVEESVGTG